MNDEARMESKRCRFCGEQILAVAIKCRHCSSNLAEGAAADPAAAPTPAAPGADARGIALALLPWVGTMLCWWWVGESPLLTASSNLTTVMLLVVLGTAILAALDASTLGFGIAGGRAPSAYGPVGTFFAVTLLWFACYPAHMVARARAGAPKRTGLAVLGELAFLASAIYLGILINDKTEELRRAFGR